jgi:hypothetical protein
MAYHQEDEILPDAISGRPSERQLSTNSIHQAPWKQDIYFFGTVAGRSFSRAFDVQPSITRTPKGVRFNVETIPEAHKEDLNMRVPSRNDVIESLCDDMSFSNLEVISMIPDNLVFANAGYGSPA